MVELNEKFKKEEVDGLKELFKLQAISSKEILTIDEASTFTGYSKSYLYKLNCMGSVPTYSASKGSKLFFKKKELEEWLTSHKKISSIDIENEVNEYLLKK